MCVHVYWGFFLERLEKTRFDSALDQLPSFVSNKIRSYRRWEDAHASLFGKLLLKKALDDLNVKHLFITIKTSLNGRPYVNSEFDFNISHSGNFIICAICKEANVGIDIEMIRPVELLDFRHVFSETEWNQIINCKNKLRTFYKFWTQKEAISKVKGEGLNASLKDISIDDDRAVYKGTFYHLKRIEIKETYESCIASTKPVSKLLLIPNVTFDDLLI